MCAAIYQRNKWTCDTTGLQVYTRKRKRLKTYDPDLNELDQFNAIFGIWLDPLGQEKNEIVECSPTLVPLSGNVEQQRWWQTPETIPTMVVVLNMTLIELPHLRGRFAAKLEAMESLKEDIADLKRQAANKQRSGGSAEIQKIVESIPIIWFRLPGIEREAKMVQTRNKSDTGGYSDLNARLANNAKDLWPGIEAADTQEVESSHYYLNRSDHSNLNRVPRCGDKYGPGHRCKTGTFKVLEAEEENGEQQEIETSSLDIDPDETAGISLHAILRDRRTLLP
ncbi:hypothetical protein Tco_0992871 [Tanacetum coccineum]|uniref:Uncharacterized protein n=1 Tax=Tanacetum coccineum TaxID=301880 RepID=A0ABQ5F4U3_9ASTR